MCIRVSINDYSSIKLIKNKNYSLQDTEITLEELIEVSNETSVKYTDNQNNKNLPPFVQADSFERIISLLENMYDNPMNDEEIAELMHFGFNFSNNKPVYRLSLIHIFFLGSNECILHSMQLGWCSICLLYTSRCV